MKSRMYARKKSTREQTPDFSTAPAPPMFQSRPFVVQTQTAEKPQQPDLKSKLRRAERYGHHLSRMQPAGDAGVNNVQDQPIQRAMAGKEIKYWVSWANKHVKEKNGKATKQSIFEFIKDQWKTEKIQTDSEEEKLIKEEIARKYFPIDESTSQQGPSNSEQGTSGVGIVLYETKEIRIMLDTHQNKHQKTKIPELGQWKSEMGTRFGEGKGKDWHKQNTAVVMQQWAENLKKGEQNALSTKIILKQGMKVFADKKRDVDGIVYDATAENIDGKIYVSYHCNPRVQER